ncbi:MAG: glycoside hydrolase family 71/99-like protein [Tepidisphaeraceae bacterium]
MCSLLPPITVRLPFWVVAIALVAPAISAADAPSTASTRGGSASIVDPSTLTGKVMCGYQGWFNTPEDGAGRGWVHWGRGAMEPGKASVEMLPDVLELDPEEKFPTAFRLAGGSVVEVFSSFNRKTVVRHFKWMRDHGIDGVFLQRFGNGIGNPRVMTHYDRILANVRAGAEAYGRAYGLMYDLSGMKDGCAATVIDDFKAQVDQTRFIRDAQYIHHNGKPVVVVWGIGFGNEHRPNLYADGFKIVDFLKNDPTYGQNTVMVGVPHWWRESKPKPPETRADFDKVLKLADIIQPWGVGSYGDLAGVTRNAEQRWMPDLAWCRANGRQYMPVVFPGFSWNNLKPGAPFNQIPRLGGRFLWQQFVEARRLGMPMVYVAMFDELDEATAVFKVTNAIPPDGKSRFLSLEGLPSDHYLKLVGQGARLIRGEITPDQEHVIKSTPTSRP